MGRAEDESSVRVEFVDDSTYPEANDLLPQTGTPNSNWSRALVALLLLLLVCLAAFSLLADPRAAAPAVTEPLPDSDPARSFPFPRAVNDTSELPVPGRIRTIADLGRGRLAMLVPANESQPPILVASADSLAWDVVATNLPGKPVHLWSSGSKTWVLVEPTPPRFAAENRLRYAPSRLDTYGLHEVDGEIVAALSLGHEPIDLATSVGRELTAHESRILVATRHEFLFALDGSAPISLGSTAGIEAQIIAGEGILVKGFDGSLEHRTVDGETQPVALPEGDVSLLHLQTVADTALAVTVGESIDVWFADADWRWERQPLPDLGGAFIGVWGGSRDSVVIDSGDRRFVFDGSTWSSASSEGAVPFVTRDGDLVAQFDEATLRTLQLLPVAE